MKVLVERATGYAIAYSELLSGDTQRYETLSVAEWSERRAAAQKQTTKVVKAGARKVKREAKAAAERVEEARAKAEAGDLAHANLDLSALDALAGE